MTYLSRHYPPTAITPLFLILMIARFIHIPRRRLLSLPNIYRYQALEGVSILTLLSILTLSVLGVGNLRDEIFDTKKSAYASHHTRSEPFPSLFSAIPVLLWTSICFYRAFRFATLDISQGK